jgi:hypothetical protein
MPAHRATPSAPQAHPGVRVARVGGLAPLQHGVTNGADDEPDGLPDLPDL